MASKRITTELVVKGIDQYSGMIRGMSGVTGKFADKVRSEVGRLQGLRGPLRLIEDFRKQQTVVKASGAAMESARERVRLLKATIKSTRNPTAQMRREFERARNVAARLEEKHKQNRRTLHGLQVQMRSAGVNTADLAGEQRRLTSTLGASNAAFARQAERMQRLKVMQDRITVGRKRMDRALARGANLSFVGNASMATGRRILTGMSAPIMKAIEFESAMSDVRKVVDFESPAAFRAMSDDILQLSTRIPMAATGLAEIVAAGGQSGIAQEDLTRFAEKAAKIGVAFDISAGRSGESMASIKTALGLTIDETGLLFDAMNHLSNNMASTAPKVLEFTTRVAADGKVKGFNATETLAFGSAMIAAGAQSDVAATSFRNMSKALVRGTSATPKQRAAFKALGLDSAKVARAMQEDAVGTTLDVMRRINELPKHLRSSTVSQIFGDEARALMPLIGNIDLLRESLGLVAEERNYAGSAEAEYAERAKTTANNMQLLRNQTTRLGVSIGEVVLPPLNELLSKSQVFIDKMVTWTKAHPKLTKWLVISGVALGGMAVAGGFLLTTAAGLIGTLAVLRFGLTGLGARALFAGGGLGGVVSKFRGLGRLGKFALAKLITPIRWGASLIPAIGWGKMSGRLGKFGMNAKGWGRLITPLKWFGRGALRFIPVIGWAIMAAEIGMFAWNFLGLKELPWRDYLNKAIEWKNWFFSFEWTAFLPEWNWDFITKFDLSGKLFFGSAPSGLSSDPAEVQSAIRRGRSQGYGQPVQPISGARASGGPVRAGMPYLVNENTPRSEIMVPSSSGAVLNVRQAQAALRRFGGASLDRIGQSTRGVRTAGLATLAASTVGLSPAAAGAPSGGNSMSARVEIGSIHIVAPSGVSDPEGLVDLLETRLGDRISATVAASFSD